MPFLTVHNCESCLWGQTGRYLFVLKPVDNTQKSCLKHPKHLIKELPWLCDFIPAADIKYLWCKVPTVPVESHTFHWNLVHPSFDSNEVSKQTNKKSWHHNDTFSSCCWWTARVETTQTSAAVIFFLSKLWINSFGYGVRKDGERKLAIVAAQTDSLWYI